MNDSPCQTSGQAASPSPRGGGTRAARPRPFLVAATAVIVFGVGIAWLLWAALGHAREPKVQVLGYQVQGQAVTVRFEVVKPAEDRVACIVRARSANGLEIARKEVVVGAGPSHTVLSRRIVGTAVPVTGEVTGCHQV